MLDAGAGPSSAKESRTLTAARPLLHQPVEDCTNWALLRLRAEIEWRTGAAIPTSQLSLLLKKGASAGNITLLYADESEALTHAMPL